MKVLERPVRLRGIRVGTCCNPRFFGRWGFAEWIEFNDFADLPSLPQLQRLVLDDGHAAVLVRFEDTGFWPPATPLPHIPCRVPHGTLTSDKVLTPDRTA